LLPLHLRQRLAIGIEYGFGELGLEKIIGLVLPENKGSIRVLEKLGFQFEKTVIEDGEEALCYSLLKNSGGS